MVGGWFSRLVRYEPEAGLAYPEALRMQESVYSRPRQVALGLGGALLGLLLLMWIPPLISAAVVQISYWAQGSPGALAAYFDQATHFALPIGMAAAHLGMAAMILVSMGLVLFLHRHRPRWLHSVQPGFRWRYAAVAFAAAVVVIGGIWALTQIGQPWQFSPEPQLGWYLLVIVLITPLQAAGEEYFFRGYLIQAISMTAVDPRARTTEVQPGRAGAAELFAKNYPIWAGIIGSALIFALLHPLPNLQSFLYPFAFGLIAGWLALKTGGLEAGIAAHVVNNVITFGFAAFSGNVVQVYADRSVEWLPLLIVVGSFALFAAAASLIAKRMNLAVRTP